MLLLAVFLFGIANLAVLPPFEAFDEAEYWSAIQQFADTGRLPRYGDARISRDVAAYPGPMPSATGQPYQDFFARGRGEVLAAGPSHYAPGDVANYEAQHPPLFVVVMAPLYRAIAALDWPQHFLVLRTANWTIAFVGFCLGALATQGVLRRREVPRSVLLVPIAWPLFFPQFFEEFTRTTSDTLCFVLIACVWCVLVGHLEHGPNWRRAAALGGLLGAGLLTKAFFLPVTAGVTLLLIVAAWRAHNFRQWPTILAVPVLAAAIGGAWYVHALFATGTLVGAADFVRARQDGGLLQSAHRHFTSPGDFVLVARLYVVGLVQMLAGFCWAGTWSFVHPPRLVVVPVAALAAIPCLLYARRVDRRDLLALAPVFLVAPVLAGLLYHLAVMLATTGESGGTPGWFFHLFAGPLALVLALGWGRRALMLPLAGYAVLHGAAMAWMQAAFFSGCLPRAGRGVVNLFDAACLLEVKQLRLLAFPDLALATGALGAAAVAAALVVFATGRRRQSAPRLRAGDPGRG